MTRKKSEIKDRVQKNVPKIWDEFPYATAAMTLAGFLVGLIVGYWAFG